MRGAAERHRGRLSILTRLQLGLEALYRVDTRLDVEAFVIDERQRQESGVARAPREQLLVSESGDELSMALFVDAKAIETLERHDPASGLHGENFADFCIALEGVSHFVYLALCAAGERRVSALELELQAEVDKYLLVLLGTWREGGAPPSDLRERLFRRVRFHDDLAPDERERYETANSAACEYAASLEERFVRRRAVDEMLGEMRRFYRMDCATKLDHIARKAA